MIRKIKSKLSVKVFLITSMLMVACCSVTYLCIAHFAPYIYSHDLAEVEELADMLSEELSHIPKEEVQYFIQGYNDILTKQYDDEFAFHLFQNSGNEIALSDLNEFTGNKIDDYKSTDTTREYEISFADSTEAYILLLAKNTNKESQVVLALQKTLPILSVAILLVSVIAAFFYTWYMTKPIKKISKLSKQMADMDFSGLCPTNRTDEIGVLSHSLNDLSKKLAAALSELQEANQKLQADIDMERRLEKQRVEFFAAASHELKTPITIIKGQLQGMLYQVGRYKDRETYLAQSLEITDTLGKMVQELLTISRLDTPGYTCKKSNLNLSNFIIDRITVFEDLFMQKDLTVEQSISPEIYILGDMQLLQKALDNLLGNAAAYSGAGNQILIKLWKETETTTLTIENTGAHIPDEAISKLFEPFYRVDQSRNRQTGGTGLGLYIVKTILDLHGAKIEITNTIQGVIVSVQF
ncbi:ATP-binding protein [Acetatifactor muris]|uniref:histidine kinase n=1 Tax=Acetatifactor muris TaxID=879566 RepID=A0A2K4ZFG7_9FIRM|nr:HAMP domain-containing sensor histidine kinase [Acetatifactor muris]MCR2047381.1 ATP-binding protein [Acetatifactor muris]SOY29186.1 Signal transduction histidine-protein kinase BaeS [Acetatifactor muris]